MIGFEAPVPARLLGGDPGRVAPIAGADSYQVDTDLAGERVERLARVIATAEHVWDSADDARAFLSTGHAMLGGKRTIEVALTELGASRVENLLWSLFHGVAAQGAIQGFFGSWCTKAKQFSRPREREFATHIDDSLRKLF